MLINVKIEFWEQLSILPATTAKIAFFVPPDVFQRQEKKVDT